MNSYTATPGTRLEDLETPTFFVDMDSFEHNLSVVADTYRDTTVKMRAHTKNLKSPFLAWRQIDIGGTVGGVCTAKVAEAEVMVHGGIDDILIPNQIVTREKLDRLCALARNADIKVCVDNPQNVRDISTAATANGVVIGILIEVDTSMGRAGIRRVEDGVDIAKLTTGLPGVKFRGVMSHQHVEGRPTIEERVLTAHKYIAMCMAAKDAIEAAGIPVEIVSTGETFCYKIATEIPGITEVEGGTYALMDTMLGFMDEFRVAGKVIAQVISTPRPGVAILDVGTRAICLITGQYGPSVEGRPGVEVDSLHEEHTVLRVAESASLEVGDKVVLIPGYQDGIVNRWDRFVAVRNGVVESVYDIPGRGCFH